MIKLKKNTRKRISFQDSFSLHISVSLVCIFIHSINVRPFIQFPRFQWKTMQFNFVCWKLITLRCWPSSDVDVISYTLIQQFEAKKEKQIIWSKTLTYTLPANQPFHIQRIWFSFFLIRHVEYDLRHFEENCALFLFGLILKIIKWILYYLCVPSWYKWLICRHIYIIWAIFSMKSRRPVQN